ncbi:hypothetical protein LSH36_350g04054 [Paralvinella palmiformis]|uniref:alpha-1,6-mannosyl-glycoprotein 6-beta-N-acetylglucosaminyltransferase n=1 Tax=Paralvinella palmiformis TaxID=53620 RepID=A0AAD9N1Q1_9ANNE|nr:hypothetical protein LSH36_350g04054 [Paralvinella palmiformis]
MKHLRNYNINFNANFQIVFLRSVNTNNGDTSSQNKPLLERIQSESDRIKNEISSISRKMELHYDELDDSMRRYAGMSTCNRSTLLMPTNLDRLSTPKSDPEIWEWIHNRIKQMWDRWRLARADLESRGDLRGFRKKKVLILPGFLKGTNFARRTNIRRGGPLGELLQWADLIAGLYVLGHEVILEHDTRIVSSRLLQYIKKSSDCEEDYHLIYVDRASMSALPAEIQKSYRCRLRLLDVYGTQAMFRDPIYKETHGIRGAPEAELLELKQYYTFYPQTPDNTFLGFIVTENQRSVTIQKENIAVLYGKDRRYITITSQIPYLEQYIGPPNVYTINVNNDTEVITGIKEAIHKTNYTPFIPDEFTMTGYLHRLSTLVERQDFCSRYRNTTWPPMTSLLAVETDLGQSCSTACHIKGSLDINCQLILWDADIVHPSVKGNRTYQACTLQENNRLFSCEGTSSDSRRICPCRRYKKYQVALPD